MEKDLNYLLKTLLDHEIEFVLIGGFASLIHGSNHLTQDLDICCVLTDSQVSKLKTSLKDLNPIHRMNLAANISFQDRPATGESVQNIYLKTDAGVLDIISQVIGVGDFNEVKKNAIKIPLFGKECLVISIDDLIKCKTALSRPKDKLVLEDLLKIKNLKSDL